MRHSIPKTIACLIIVILSVAFLAFTQESTPTSVAGGGGGSSFADTGFPSGGRVAEVSVWSGDVVDSVQIAYELPDGRTVASARHGGPGGQPNTFRLDSDEYITGISGRYGNYIDSLTIYTNKRTSPAYGGRGGERDFRVNAPSRSQAVGFIGRSGEYLDAIGLMCIPINLLQADQTQIFGGRGGSAFSDQNIPQGARISEVRVQAGGMIDGIQAVYTLQNGRQQEGQFHGGRGGRGNVFRLDSDEYIVAISGRYGENVDSLTIRTNKRTSPTYGGRGGDRDYSVQVPSGSMAIGFIGRSGQRLDAIGLVYARTGSYRNRFRLPGRDR